MLNASLLPNEVKGDCQNCSPSPSSAISCSFFDQVSSIYNTTAKPSSSAIQHPKDQRALYMADRSENKLPEVASRAASPALSDFSEFTILSRSPSPVLDYDPEYVSLSSSPLDVVYVEEQLPRYDVRYVLRKMKKAHSPEERYASHCGEAQLVLTT